MRTFLGMVTTSLRLTRRRPTEALVLGTLVALMTTGGIVVDGVRHGKLRQLTESLVQSPTGRLVEVWVTDEESPISSQVEAALRREIPELKVLIPKMTKLVDLAVPGGPSTGGITLVPTRPGDPYLQFYGIEAPPVDPPGIVLGGALAHRLRVGPGDPLILKVSRSGSSSGTEGEELHVKVAGVLDLGGGKGESAFVHVDVITAVELFQRGHPVERFGWAGSPQPVTPAYRGYLSFAKTPYEQSDEFRLRARGLQARRLPHDERTRFCYGLLEDHDLFVHWITTADRDLAARLRLPASEVEEITDSDDVVMPWTPPLKAQLGGEDRTLVGCSGEPRWLRDYLKSEDYCFAPEAEELNAVVASSGANGEDATAALNAFGCEIPVNLRSPGEKPADERLARLGIAVVPAGLLAHLHMVEEGKAAWDESTGLFRSIPQDVSFFRCRAYARTLFDVPALDAALRERGYGTSSHSTQVREIQKQLRGLQDIVRIVGVVLVVIAISVLTVAFHGAGKRRRRCIGMLRAMGWSRAGIFLSMILMALAVSVVSLAVTAGLSIVATTVTSWLFVPCAWMPQRVALMGAGASLACLAGVLWPAWWASRQEPVRAILEGQL